MIREPGNRAELKRFFEKRARPDEGTVPAEWSVPDVAGTFDDDDDPSDDLD